jgi:hypothetical protein
VQRPAGHSVGLRPVCRPVFCPKERNMNSIVYLVGLAVIVIAILSFIGIR